MTDQEIFKSGSTTYYWSSKFFPKDTRDDVFKLYSFVRVVDDYVDSAEPDIESFERIEKRWHKLKKHLSTDTTMLDDSTLERVLHNICYVVHRYNCDPAWVDAFFKSMRMDIERRDYETMDDTIDYMYGSAEVIGLFMAKIMGLPEKAYDSARMLGRSMQYINFIRDIAEDNELGRQYFPQRLLITHGLKSLDQKEAERKPAEFAEFIRNQVKTYRAWQQEAAKGYRYIPRRARVAIRTATDMYSWTADVIADNPQIIFKKKIKPSKRRIVQGGIKRSLHA
jgi:phytoene synthase